jgi:hypothetical protein
LEHDGAVPSLLGAAAELGLTEVLRLAVRYSHSFLVSRTAGACAKPTAGVDVWLPLQIATLNGASGREAGLSGRTGVRTKAAMSGRRTFTSKLSNMLRAQKKGRPKAAVPMVFELPQAIATIVL